MKNVLTFIIFLLIFSNVYTEGNVFVLCYHTFLGKNFDTDFPPETFSNQIEKLKNMGYRFVSFNDIVNSNVTGDTNILITIDDGNHSVDAVYNNLLLSNNIKPILFIYPAIINKMHYALTFNKLKEYMKDGATIGAHGYYHLYVTEKLFKKSRSSFNREIYRSKSKLEKGLSRNINIYAYPYGSFSGITIEYLKKAGFQYAFSLKQGMLHVPLAENANPYNLPRYIVEKSTWKNIYSTLKKNVDINSRIVHKKRKRYANI